MSRCDSFILLLLLLIAIIVAVADNNDVMEWLSHPVQACIRDCQPSYDVAVED